RDISTRGWWRGQGPPRPQDPQLPPAPPGGTHGEPSHPPSRNFPCPALSLSTVDLCPLQPGRQAQRGVSGREGLGGAWAGDASEGSLAGREESGEDEKWRKWRAVPGEE